MVLLCAQARRLPYSDPWKLLLEKWTAGELELEDFDGFPAGWTRVHEVGQALEDDVVVYSITPEDVRGLLDRLDGVDQAVDQAPLEDVLERARARDLVPGHMGFLISDGLVVTARVGVGVYAYPYARELGQVAQLWRFAG